MKKAVLADVLLIGSFKGWYCVLLHPCLRQNDTDIMLIKRDRLRIILRFFPFVAQGVVNGLDGLKITVLSQRFLNQGCKGLFLKRRRKRQLTAEYTLCQIKRQILRITAWMSLIRSLKAGNRKPAAGMPTTQSRILLRKDCCSLS